QADLHSQSPFPFMAAAGMAMHAGDARSALTLADESLARLASMDANGGETWIIKAVALVQLGELDQARTALAHLEGDLTKHPFALSAAALIDTLEQYPEQALANAEIVTDA